MISSTPSPVHTPSHSLTRLKFPNEDSSSSSSSSESSSSSYKTASVGKSTIRHAANESSSSNNEDVRMESSSSEASSSSSSSDVEEEEENSESSSSEEEVDGAESTDEEDWADPNAEYKLLADEFIDVATEAAKPYITKGVQKGIAYSTQQGVAQIPHPIAKAGCSIVGSSAQLSAEPIIDSTVDSSAGISKAGAHVSIDKGSITIANLKKKVIEIFRRSCSHRS